MIKYIKMFENFDEPLPFNNGEFMVLSFRDWLLLVEVTTETLESDVPNFDYCCCTTLSDHYKIYELYFNTKTKKYVHVVTTDGRNDTKDYEFNILYRGKNYEEAFIKYSELNDAKKFGL